MLDKLLNYAPYLVELSLTNFYIQGCVIPNLLNVILSKPYSLELGKPCVFSALALTPLYSRSVETSAMLRLFFLSFSVTGIFDMGTSDMGDSLRDPAMVPPFSRYLIALPMSSVMGFSLRDVRIDFEEI